MYKIGIDLGGTNIAAAIIDRDCKIIKKTSIKTKLPRTAEEISEDIAYVTTAVCKKADIDFAEVESVGVGAPGVINKEGIVEFSANLNFNNVPFKQMLSEKINKPIYIDNDANCAALGEQIAGCGNRTSDFIMVTLGTGVGGGIIVDNKLITGVNGACGEIGHMVIVKGGLKCSCGRRGCFEKYASATALIEQTKEALKSDVNKKSYIWKVIDNDISKINGKTAFIAMEYNDRLATSIVNEYLDYLSCGIANLINIFQPKYICIGGGIGTEGDTLIEPLQDIVSKEIYTRNSNKQTKITVAILGNDAGLIGAALLNS